MEAEPLPGVAPAESSLALCAAPIAAAGYSTRQAQFLALVALYGGYFLRRQYLTFAGCRQGFADFRFIKHLIARRHAHPIRFGRRGHVYRLRLRRLCRRADLPAGYVGSGTSVRHVLQTLMAIDFVLAHRTTRFCVSAEEKSALLTELGVEADCWPRRRGESPVASSSNTVLWDANNRPWYRDADEPRLWVVFADVHNTLAAFRTFLHQYRALLVSATSGVMYVSRSAATAPVQRVFSRTIAGHVRQPAGNHDEFLLVCRVRRATERNDFREVSVADLQRFGQLRGRFSARRYDDLYQAWLKDPAVLSPESEVAAKVTVDCALRVHRLLHWYGYGLTPLISSPTHAAGQVRSETPC
jgi:hypothetical protein